MHDLQSVPYVPGADASRSFDLYYDQATADRPLLVFVHGGAWRAEDKAHHADLARSLAARSGCAVAVPNYRLTPNAPTPDTALTHPAHAEDLLAFLHFALAYAPADGVRAYDPTKLVLIGHSCSAHMLCSILRDSTAVTPSLTPSAQLLRATRGVIMSEGIYDIDLLLDSFPAYLDWFIGSAFGAASNYTQYNVLDYPHRTGAEHIRWLILHSTGDTLVDVKQSGAITIRLPVVEPSASAKTTSPTSPQGEDGLVRWDFTTLTEEHNDLLRGDAYVELVGSFVESLL